MKRSVWLGMLLAMSMGKAALAEEGDKEESLGTVVVTATRSEQPVEQATQSIDIITSEEIASKQTNSVAELLRDIAGVDVVTTGSPGKVTSVFIRGSDSDQVLVLVDGVEVNSPTLGQFNLATLMTDNVERVEVLRGAGGTLYGSEAIGGVINVITKRGRGAPTASLKTAGGNGDRFESLFEYSGGHGPVGITASLGYLTMAGFQPYNDDFTDLNSSLRADVDLLERGTLRGFFRSTSSKRGLVDNLYFLGMRDRNARFEEDRYQYKAEWEHEPIDGLTYSLGGSYVDADDDFSDSDAPAYLSVQSNISSNIITGEAQASYLFREMSLTTAGFEYQEMSAHPRFRNVEADGVTITPARYNANRSNFAGFVQEQLFFFDERLIGTGGVRVDSDEGFGEQVSGSFSIGYLQHWEESERWSTRVRGGYSDGFKAPTFNELYFPNYGNRDLDPETSGEWNGGIVQRLWGEAFTLDATYFSRQTRDLIQGVFIPATGTFLAQNIGRVDVKGVETGVTITPTEELSFRGTYTYLDWDVNESPFTLLRRPHNRMATTIRYARENMFRPNHRADLSLNVNYVGHRHDYGSLGVEKNDDYVVVGLALTYGLPGPIESIRGMEFFGRVGNLFDKRYEEAIGFEAPPIHFLAGVRVSL